MKVTAWNNGSLLKSGAGYGLKVSIRDRDTYFDPGVESVILRLPNSKEVAVNTAKASFWSGTCRELIDREIGRWLIDSGYAPWPKGNPPKFNLTRTGERYDLSVSE